MEINYKIIHSFLKELCSLCDNDEYIIICEFSRQGSNFYVFDQTHLELNPRANIYYTINPRRVDRSKKLAGPGTKESIKHVIALYADLDVKSSAHPTGTFATKDEALKKLLDFPLEPTVIIGSGHGLQALWMLKEFLTLNEDIDLEEFEAILRGLQQLLNADTTADITRLFRLPGTFNNKNPEQPIPVKIVKKTEKRYNIGDFDFITPVYSASTGDYPLNMQLNFTPVDLSRLSDRILSIIQFGRDPREPSKNDRSELIQSVVTAMVAKGYSDDEIYSVLINPRYKISEKIQEKRSEHEKKRYIALSITKAKAYIKEHRESEEHEKTAHIELPFQVLGFTIDKKIWVWYQGNLISFNARQLTRDELTLFTGEVSREQFISMKKAMLTTAHTKGLIDAENTIKKGIFAFDNEFLINTGKAAVLVNNGDIIILDEPVFKGKIITFDRDPFIDIDRFKDCYQNVNITDVFYKLYELISCWNFEDGEMIPYITAFVMLAPFQHAMKWRPWIYLTGSFGTGKTTFFDEVLGIYGNLTVRIDKSTAHALVQAIGNTGKIAVLDEFEKDKKLGEILEIAKLTNAGGVYTRGTTTDKNKTWNLHHMPWFGSIYPAGNDAAQYSRTVFFELLSPRKDPPPKFLTRAEKDQLKHEIIASVSRSWDEIEEKARDYQRRKAEYQVQDGRIIDNFMYAAALLDVATGEGGIPEFAQRIRFVVDEVKLLTTILTTLVEDKQIYDYLENGPTSTCEKYGLKKVTSHGKEYLAIYDSQVKRYLLKDTMWRNLDIAKPLLRLSDTKQKQPVKLSGKARRAVLIPWDTVQKLMNEAEESE